MEEFAQLIPPIINRWVFLHGALLTLADIKSKIAHWLQSTTSSCACLWVSLIRVNCSNHLGKWKEGDNELDRQFGGVWLKRDDVLMDKNKDNGETRNWSYLSRPQLHLPMFDLMHKNARFNEGKYTWSVLLIILLAPAFYLLTILYEPWPPCMGQPSEVQLCFVWTSVL